MKVIESLFTALIWLLGLFLGLYIVFGNKKAEKLSQTQDTGEISYEQTGDNAKGEHDALFDGE